jgi:flavin reductase (DIM6/NTAB) family NADH-FMN oxidoreductase RutF
MSEFISIDPAHTPVPQMHQYLVGSVAPRPIAFVSSLSAAGERNLAPYSFFNVFGAKPPIVVFSPNHRVKDQTAKDTYHNVMATRECVINMVSYDMTHQMSLASAEYPAEVDEFVKAGFTPLASEVVGAPRVAESPVQMECKVRDIVSMGAGGGAANLVICEVVRMHVRTDILDENGTIDPHKIDLVSRMGKMYYARASGAAVFALPQPGGVLGIGFDQLPAVIRHSAVLTGRHLAQLASFTAIPSPSYAILSEPRVMDALAGNAQDRDLHLHRFAAELIDQGAVEKAWQVLLAE